MGVYKVEDSAHLESRQVPTIIPQRVSEVASAS
jgi:hypothetical protein